MGSHWSQFHVGGTTRTTGCLSPLITSPPPTFKEYSNIFLKSLAATIRLRRPDLHSVMVPVDSAEPISEAPPANFFSKHVTQIEGVGEPINPCFFVNSQTDPTNWYVFTYNLKSGP